MFDIFIKWKKKIAQYVETRIRLVQLGFVEKTANVLSYFIFTIILSFIVFGALLFLGLGLAEWFTALVDSRIGGFFLAGGVYILLVFMLLAARKPVMRMLADVFVRQLTQSDDDDDDKEKNA